MRILMKVLIGLAAIAIVSCQKELSLENPNHLPPPPPDPTPDTLGDLLVRSVNITSPTDSTVTLYSYDAAKRLTAVNTTGTMFGVDASESMSITRDGSGNISKIVSITAGVGGTLNADVVYDNANNRYSHSIIKYTFSGMTFVDSTIFTYDGTGKIILATDYSQDLTGSYQLFLQNVYTYTGAGIDSAKLFEANTTTGSLDWTSANIYGYDNMVNPLILSNGDAVVLLLPELYSTHSVNSLKQVSVVTGTTTSTTTVFTYNTKNKPVTSTSTMQPGGATSTGRYYYQ